MVMQLKNALIGAIVGGLIGIGVLVAAFMFFGAQHTALALVVAVLVGVGVRAMVSTKGHASYLRGAITALVAIAAFVGGNFVVAKFAQSQMAANAGQPMPCGSDSPQAIRPKKRTTPAKQRLSRLQRQSKWSAAMDAGPAGGRMTGADEAGVLNLGLYLDLGRDAGRLRAGPRQRAKSWQCPRLPKRRHLQRQLLDDGRHRRSRRRPGQPQSRKLPVANRVARMHEHQHVERQVVARNIQHPQLENNKQRDRYLPIEARRDDKSDDRRQRRRRAH